jgi:DNA polymerase-3 subunit epsilon
MFNNIKINKALAVVDLETTGTDYAKDKIVEIAVIKLLPDGTVQEMIDRINPGIPIPKSSSDIHGIKDEDVKDCPKFSDVAVLYSSFMNDCDLCGFNSNRFDFPFLVEEFLKAGVNFNTDGRNFVDVQRIFHLMEPRNLGAAYKFYCEKDLVDAHSAAADARATLEILNSQLSRYPEKLKSDMNLIHNITKDGDYVDMGRKMYYDNGIEKFNFGKYKGRAVKEVFTIEPQYYDWIMRSDFPLDLKERLKAIREKK